MRWVFFFLVRASGQNGSGPVPPAVGAVLPCQMPGGCRGLFGTVEQCEACRP